MHCQQPRYLNQKASYVIMALFGIWIEKQEVELVNRGRDKEVERGGCVLNSSHFQGQSVRDLPWHPSLGNIDSLRCSLFLHRGRCASSHPVRHKKTDNLKVRAWLLEARLQMPNTQETSTSHALDGTQWGVSVVYCRCLFTLWFVTSLVVYACLSVACGRLSSAMLYIFVCCAKRVHWMWLK